MPKLSLSQESIHALRLPFIWNERRGRVGIRGLVTLWLEHLLSKRKAHAYCIQTEEVDNGFQISSKLRNHQPERDAGGKLSPFSLLTDTGPLQRERKCYAKSKKRVKKEKGKDGLLKQER